MSATSALQSLGSYELLQVIAEGGMGTVYKARHGQTGQLVAVKVVPAHLTKNAVLMKRFKKEYNAARAIDHPNIVRALELGHNGTSPYLVMEYVDGESLGQKLEREHHLPESEATRIIAQVAQGLNKAHKLGMVHRDVKPDNILITSDGQVKLADLGLVKEADGDLNLTRTGRGLGTPHFMAPEQFKNAKNADVRCDIYSLAATLYMMVTGELPFKSCGPVDAWMKKIKNDLVPPRQIQPQISERLDWAIRRGMCPDPNQRPASCREFVEDLTGHSTRKLTPLLPEAQGEVKVSGPDRWYLVYKDAEGVVHSVKGSTAGIRRSVKEKGLGDVNNIRVSRHKTGPFESLRAHPEFRDLVVDVAAPLPPPVMGQTPLPPPTKPIAVSAKAPTLPPSQSTLNPVPTLETCRPEKAASYREKPAPHFVLGPEQGQADWLKWLGVVLLASVSALLGYFLLPILTGHRF